MTLHIDNETNVVVQLDSRRTQVDGVPGMRLTGTTLIANDSLPIRGRSSHLVVLHLSNHRVSF